MGGGPIRAADRHQPRLDLDNDPGTDNRVESEPLAVVRIIGGRHDGDRFVIRLDQLSDRKTIRYLAEPYVVVTDSRTGRWIAVPARSDGLPPTPG